MTEASGASSQRRRPVAGFQKGRSGNPAGRPKRTAAEKAAALVLRRAREAVAKDFTVAIKAALPQAFDALLDLVDTGPAAVRRQAAVDIVRLAGFEPAQRAVIANLNADTDWTVIDRETLRKAATSLLEASQ